MGVHSRAGTRDCFYFRETSPGGLTYPFEVHRLHRHIHALHHLLHVPGNLAHGNCGLHSAGNGIDAGGQLQEVQLLGLLADGILGVDACDVVVALLHGLATVLAESRQMHTGLANLFHFGLLELFIFPGLERLAVQRLGGELGRVSRRGQQRGWAGCGTLRLNRAASSPDMLKRGAWGARLGWCGLRSLSALCAVENAEVIAAAAD